MFNKEAYLRGTKPSCIRTLYQWGKSRALQVGEENVYDFSLGNPATPPPAPVLDAFTILSQREDAKSLHGYTPAGGDPHVKAQIAEDLNRRFDASVTGDHLFLTAGACPALVATFGALTLSHETEFIAIAPYFPEYRVLAGIEGATLRVVEADYPQFQIDFSHLEAAITPHTQAVILNSPNNPSGVVYTRETLEQLACLLQKKSLEYEKPIYILSDEPYRELVYRDTEVPYIPHIYPNTIICYSYSKSLSLPGDRIGYVLVPPTAEDSEALLAAIAGEARKVGHVCAPALLQQVVGMCASVLPDLSDYNANRRLLVDSLTAMGYECAYPDGAFYLFVKAPGGDGDAFSEQAKAFDLLVVSGKDFGCPSYIRIAYCVSRDTVSAALPAFEKLMALYKEAPSHFSKSGC